jgi:drug/metabolite transporter (DMT)-like permease
MTHHWGYIGAVTAALLFGLSSTLNKIVLGDIHPTVVAGAVYLVAGIVLSIIKYTPINNLILSLLETPTETEDIITSRDYRILVYVIISGSLIAPYLYMHGLNLTTAVNTSLLLNMEALFTVFIALTFLREKGSKKDYIGVILIIIGAIFVTTQGEFSKLDLMGRMLGNLLIVGACLFWGIDNNLSKFLSKKRDLIYITILKCSIGGTLLLIISMILGSGIYIPLKTLPYIFTVGGLSIGFSIILFLFSLREIGAMKTGVIFSTSSLIGAVMAFILLDEPFTTIQFIAGLVMLYGVYLLYTE